jgi:hypothetical protein
MAILFSKNGQDAKWLKPVGFADETVLQKYIVDNPHSIPLSGFKEDANLVIICREFTTEHGEFIDHVGLDKDGEIYLIETKQYSNTDKRRVVAQVIDYGATLSSTPSSFDSFIEKSGNWISKTYHITLDEYLQSHFNFDEKELEILYQNIESNYSANKFRFIIVMDKANDKIKKYVSFMNANSNFSIFLSEFQRYEEGDYEIIIPNLFGAENERRKTSTSSTRNNWNKNDFDESFSNADHDAKTKEAIESLITFTKNRMPKDWENTWHEYFGGTGKEPIFLGYLPKIYEGERAVFQIYSKSGDISIKFWALHEDISLLKKFVQECNENNFEIIKTKHDSGVNQLFLKKEEWVPKVKDFLSILEHCF